MPSTTASSRRSVLRRRRERSGRRPAGSLRAAKQRAVEIKTAYAAKVATIKGRHRFAREARTTEGEVLWKTNRADQQGRP